MTAAIPIRRQITGALLRRYRESAGYGLADGARILECDRSKVSRIETGHRGIRQRDMRDLLAGYGVPVLDHAVLLDLANPGAPAGWWDGYADVLSRNERDCLIIEALAVGICSFDPLRIPALLQTEAYLRAAAATGETDPDRCAEAMLLRQRLIHDELKTGVSAVISEAALRQQANGAELMLNQVRYLADLATCPQVTLQVLPLASLVPPNAAGPVTLLQFAPGASLTVALVATPAGPVCLDGEAEVARCTRAFADLQATALSPARSVRMLRRMAWGQQ